MEKSVLQIVAALAVLALYYWTLFVSPVTIESVAAAGAGSLTLEESRELLDQSRTALRDREFDDALAITRRLHEAYPRNHIYLYQLATIAQELGDPGAEADYWEKYLLASPTPIEACPRVGQAYAEAGRAAESLQAFERCLAFDPKDPDSLFWVAKAYEGSGRLGEAEEHYRRGLEAAPGYVDSRVGLGRVLLRQGKLADARRVVAEVHERAPDNVDGLLLAGLVERADGHLDAAKRHLERGAARSPGYVDFWVVLGGIAEQEERAGDALRYYDKVLELRPERSDIAAKRRRLTRG